MNKIYIDVETTGFDVEKDQITEIAAIIENSEGVILDKFEVTINLYPNCHPSLGALLVTKINPFSKDWKDKSISLFEAAHKLKEFCEKNMHGHKLLFSAYNAEFDQVRIYHLLKTCLIDPNKLFYSEAFDPLVTTKQLTEKNIIKTPLKTGKNGGFYNSSTLGDVSVALKLITEEKLSTLHRAMEDTELLRLVVHEIYKIRTGHEYKGLKSNPEDFEFGDYIFCATNHPIDGITKQEVIINKNDKENRKILATDLSHFELFGLDKDSMKIYNYSDFFFSEKKEDEESKIFTKKFIERNYSKIRMLFNLLKDSHHEKDTFDLEKAKKLAEEGKSLFYLAYKGEEISPEKLGFSSKTKIVKGEVKGKEVSILEHPSGYFLIKANGGERKSFTKGDIGIKIQALIPKAPKGGKFIKALTDQLGSVKDFKDENHPYSILNEFKRRKQTDKDLSDSEKSILRDSYTYYKGLYPKIFK